MTRSTEDGSSATDYNTTGENYIDSEISFAENGGGHITKHSFLEDGGMFFDTLEGSSNDYYADYGYIYQGTTYAYRGGGCGGGAACGAFCVRLIGAASDASWRIGAAPSCKSLS